MISIKIDNEDFIVPYFLINKKYEDISNNSIYKALKFIGNYIDKKILKPNHLLYPKFRMKLENFYYSLSNNT